MTQNWAGIEDQKTQQRGFYQRPGPAAPLVIQFPANELGEQQQVVPSPWAPATLMGDLDDSGQANSSNSAYQINK